MPTTITGTSTYPTTIQIPSDGDPRNASAVNVPIQALADRTTYLSGQVGSLQTATATLSYLPWVGSFGSKTLYSARGAVDGSGRVWLGGNDNSTNYAHLYLIADGNGSIVRNDPITTALGNTSEFILDVAAAADGSVVACTNTRYVFQADTIGGCSKPDVFLAAGAFVTAVCFQPSQSKWLCAGATSTAVTVRSSTNRTTWTTVSTPAGWNTNVTTSIKFAAVPGSSAILAVGKGSGTTWYTSISTDGGVNWTNRTSRTTSLASASSAVIDGLTVDGTGAYVTISGVAGCEVWFSSDLGVTWVLKTTLSTVTLGRIASTTDGYGASILVAPAIPIFGAGPPLPIIVCSSNGGANWQSLQVGPSDGNQIGQAFNTGTQLVAIFAGSNSVVGSVNALFSLRTGSPTLTAVT